MSITEQLDLAIKLDERKTTDGFYSMSTSKGTVDRATYMTNADWTTFFSNMNPEARCEFCNGSGGELFEKNGCPPKMASYGSSSRMIYMLSRNQKNFHFEKQLPTTVGGKANLDGFYEDEKHYIFVEAKCHEPYSSKINNVSDSYTCLYDYINDHMADKIKIEMTPSKCGRYNNVNYLAKSNSLENFELLEHFDLKQMICHLLGIATGMLNGTLEKKATNFIYLLYDPTKLAISDKYKSKINEIYVKTCHECNLIDFAELFRVILIFLREHTDAGVMTDEEIKTVVSNFKFNLMSQEEYAKELSKL